MAKDVILVHRGDARAARSLANALIGELADVTLHRDSIAQLIERAAGSLDQAEAARLAALLRELVKLHNRVSSMQKLADAMARVQTLGASGIRHRRRRRWQQPTRHDERGRVAG
jgi:hypothetical protein